MPEAYCVRRTAHLFILLCVPWLVFCPGAYGVRRRCYRHTGGRLACRTNGLPPGEGWTPVEPGGSSQPGGWSAGNVNGNGGSWNTGSGNGNANWNPVPGGGGNNGWPQTRPQGRPGYRPPQSTRRPPFYRKPRFCYFKKKHGPCKWRFFMWWYNAETNKCEQFVYGGCRGNRNRFLSCFECLVTCSGNPRTKNRCIRLHNRFG
ncbi:uncharacterized protein LOC144166590 isoform X2 [Haemaphysalis longicornis]